MAETIRLTRRVVGENIWLAHTTDEPASHDRLARLTAYELQPEVLESEQVVGAAMLAELENRA